MASFDHWTVQARGDSGEYYFQSGMTDEQSWEMQKQLRKELTREGTPRYTQVVEYNRLTGGCRYYTHEEALWGYENLAQGS